MQKNDEIDDEGTFSCVDETAKSICVWQDYYKCYIKCYFNTTHTEFFLSIWRECKIIFR